MKRTLADFNFFYSLFLPITGFGTICHYRNITIKGKENIPEGEHYIIAPNHQNALMEPMLVLQMTRKTTVFLARADIFKKPVARFFLTWLRISPVYRIRDGRDQLSKNEEVFKNARAALETGAPLCLMAEGRHNDKHQLLPLVKGMFRIACGTQKELGDKPLYILPVGIDYDDYEDLYSSVCVNIGKPIDVRSFMTEYDGNEPVALNQMRASLTKSLKGQIHHVNSQEHYEAEYAYCHYKTQELLQQLGEKNNAWGRYMARKYCSEQMLLKSEEEQSVCYEQGERFAEQCRRAGVPMWFASKGWSQRQSVEAILIILIVLGVLIGTRLLKFWLLSNLVLFLPTHIICKKKIKDPQFRSSVNYGIRLLLQFINAIVVFIVATCSRGFLFGVGMVLLGMMSAYITPRLFILFRDLWYGSRLRRVK